MIVKSAGARAWVLPLAIFCVIACLLMSLLLGAVNLTFASLLDCVLGRADLQSQLIFEKLRLPRALLAASIGLSLAVCGCATHSLFRNPLADPSLIGVSAGATAGASLVIVFLNPQQSNFVGLSLVSLGAFAGATLVVALVYRMARHSYGTSIATMLLAGIAFTYLAGSVSGFLEYLADNDMLRRLSLWRMGGQDGADYAQGSISIGVALVVMFLLFRQAAALDALLLGESEARHLGVRVDRLKQLIILCVAAGVGTSVAFAGTIAFIGLVVPHVLRMLLGPSHRLLMPVAACAGAVLLLLSDIAARTLLAPNELPVGLLTAFIGTPVFLLLLRRHYQFGG